MKKLIAFIAFITLGINLTAQETINIPDTLDNEWALTWVAGVNGSQSTYNNWAAGGQNNVAATFFTRQNGAYRKGKFTYGYVIRLRYGVTNIEGEDSRKTDDRIATKHRASYILNEDNTMNMFADVSFVTQFYDGYEYADGTRTKISEFMAPAYFAQNIGYAYTPYDFISIEAGMGLKQTYVGTENLLPAYGVNVGENVFSEGGISTGISFTKEVFKNVNYTSRFETFTNLKRSLDRTDVSWANEVTGKINDFLNASFQFEMVYDDDITTELQTKQVLSAGLLVNLK